MAGESLGFGIDLLKNAMSANSANIAATKQRTAGLIEEGLAWGRNESDNKAIAAANLQNTIRTGYKVGLLNVQRGQAKKLALQQGIGLLRSKQQVLGAANANSAAAGSVGASVDAVISDIEQRTSDATGQLGEDYYQTTQNFDTQLTDILTAGRDSLLSSSKAQIRATPEAAHIGAGEVLLGTAIDTASAYASAAMRLGTK